MKFIVSVVLTKGEEDGIHQLYTIDANNENEATGYAFTDSTKRHPGYSVGSMITTKIDSIDNIGEERTSE